MESLPISSEVRIARAEHSISRSRLNRAALQTLYGLTDAGYEALLVGGGVRDLLLGLAPKDFDVATNATPEQVLEVFRRCRLIGRRFRLAHVRFGSEVIEVATFRAAPRTPDGDGEIEEEDGEALDSDQHDGVHLLDDSGRILRDNVYGSLEQDAFRRDFTINALYYDINDFCVVDFVGGMEDLAARRLRLIGDPATRYREDPVRMLRAVRFAAKLGFTIDASAAEPIYELRDLLADVPPARLFDESLKLFLSESAQASFDGLWEFGLFDVMFPQVARVMEGPDGVRAERIIRLALESTAKRIAEDRPVTPGFLFAALLWVPVQQRSQALQDGGMIPSQALAQASAELMNDQSGRVAIPRRFSGMQQDIWQMQPRFEARRGKRPYRLVENKRFRAAYDFLLLRAQAGEVDPELAQWWTDFQEANPDIVQRMVDEAPTSSADRPPRRRRRRR